MLIQLRRPKQVAVEGNVRNCHPGDWVTVGRQTAMQWLASGDAWIPPARQKLLLPEDAGILVWGRSHHVDQLRAALQGSDDTIGIVSGQTPDIPFGKTLIWQPALPLKAHLLPVGFHFLERWQIALPLRDYDELALMVGTEMQREQARQILHDPRVPLYDTRLIFARRCDDTLALIAQWQEQVAAGQEERLAFLVALYQVKPLVLALPIEWTK